MENRGNWLIYGATSYTSELAADKRLPVACFLEYVGSEWGVQCAVDRYGADGWGYAVRLAGGRAVFRDRFDERASSISYPVYEHCWGTGEP